MKLYFGVENHHPDYYSSGHPNYVLNGKSTLDVAQELENRYGVMQKFFDENKEFVAENVTAALASRIGGGKSDFYDLEEVQRSFRHALYTNQLETKIPNTPTKAAMLGVNSRLNRATGSKRPSFVDGGEYMASFRAWIE